MFEWLFNPFHATGLFIYPLKTENQWYTVFPAVYIETSGRKLVKRKYPHIHRFRNNYLTVPSYITLQGFSFRYTGTPAVAGRVL